MNPRRKRKNTIFVHGFGEEQYPTTPEPPAQPPDPLKDQATSAGLDYDSQKGVGPYSDGSYYVGEQQYGFWKMDACTEVPGNPGKYWCPADAFLGPQSPQQATVTQGGPFDDPVIDVPPVDTPTNTGGTTPGTGGSIPTTGNGTGGSGAPVSLPVTGTGGGGGQPGPASTCPTSAFPWLLLALVAWAAYEMGKEYG